MVDQPEMTDSVFWVSDFTIEVHEYGSERVLGFNGTTEWALDSVPIENCLWLPREDQLRELLGGTFRSLSTSPGGFEVRIRFRGEEQSYESESAADAYGEALLTLVTASAPF